MGLGLDRAGGAARLIRPALAGLVALSVVAACTSPAIVPSASPSAIAVLVPIPTPAPPTALPSPTPTRYVNAVLGYAVTLPPPWRVSECLSGVATNGGGYIGTDTLTWRTAAEEHDSGAGGETGPTGSLTWVIVVMAETSSQTPTEYAAARGASNVVPTAIDGKPAVHLNEAMLGSPAYFVTNAGRMYTISFSAVSYVPQPPAATEAIFDAIARSVSFVTPTARPTPSPAPQLSAEVTTLVDAVTAAFAASDADRLRDLMPPKCWFSYGYYQGGPGSTSRETVADGLRVAFAQGLKVTVEARPVMSAAPVLKGPFWVWSTWSAYQTTNGVAPQQSVQLIFDQIDGRWYWRSALYRADALRH